MTQPLCKNCRHWIAMPDNIAMDTPEGTRICELATSYRGGQENSETLAWAIDAEEYLALLVTRPDFGCNQFEKEQRD